MFFLFPHVFAPAVTKLEAVVDEFREVDGAMSLNALATFLHVSRRLTALQTKKQNLRELSDEMGLPHSSCIRLIASLSEGGPGLKSWNLLERAVDPADRRERTIGLSSDGLKLLAKVGQQLSTVTSR